jgi:hypothetical protein
VTFLSRASETLKSVNIKLDLLWNSSSLSSNTVTLISCNQSVTTLTQDVFRYDIETRMTNLSTQFQTQILITADVNLSSLVYSNRTENRALTASASIASQSSNMQHSNNSFFATVDSRSITNISASSFSGNASTWKVLNDCFSSIVILWFLIGITLHRVMIV